MERRPPSPLDFQHLEQQPQPDGPYVHPGVSPEAARYAQQVAARRAQHALPKINEPVAGGPVPMIPRLDGPPQKGLTMSEMAGRERGAPFQGGIVSGQQQPQLQLTPADLLPKEAMNDPSFMQGTGSMLAQSQPMLAAKYGVYRNGQFIPPQKLFPADRPQLSSSTLEGLRAVAQANNPTGSLPDTDAQVEREVAAGPAGAAARVGNLPGDQSVDADDKKLKETIGKLDEFEFDSFRQAMMKDILNNPDQKVIIESRLTPLDITDMIVSGFVKQDVPVIPGRLSFTFRSMTGEEDLEIKRLIMAESKSLEVSDRYLLDKYAFMSMTMGLVAINGKPFGDVYDTAGGFKDDMFWAKYKRVIRLPLHMLASIGLNQMWFEQRARKLYVAEKVGNG